MSTLAIVQTFPEYKYPGPRYRRLGPQSGEEFREKHFIPWLKEHQNERELAIDINGFVAYPPSFFKEFLLGTAERKEFKVILKKLKIKCDNSEYRERISQIIKEIS